MFDLGFSEEIDLEADFKPNVINTTVYIISMALQVSTFAINYKVGTSGAFPAPLFLSKHCANNCWSIYEKMSATWKDSVKTSVIFLF